MKDNDKILYDLLKEVREEQKEDSKKIAKTEVCVENMQSDLKGVMAETAINTKHMGEHMRRTDILEQLHIDNQQRIVQLEEDAKKKEEKIQSLKTEKEAKKLVKSWFKDNIKWILTVSTLLVGLVSKVVGLW